MRFFDLFKKKEKVLSEVTLSAEEQKWNKIWELWENEEAESPYAELMTYESEINNGGHSQFFFNVSNTSDLSKTVDTLYSILPAPLKGNLERAYNAYLLLDDEDEDENEETDELWDECDDVFYENEAVVEKILKEYSAGIVL